MTAFLDTNIAVYAQDHGAGRKQVAAASVIAERADELVVSSQVLAEFYWATTHRLDPPLPHGAARAATEALSALPTVTTDAALILAGIDTAAAAGIALWDALIIEAARRAGCDEVLTEDLNHGQVINGVHITNPLLET